jgi:hypothetical protein
MYLYCTEILSVLPLHSNSYQNYSTVQWNAEKAYWYLIDMRFLKNQWFATKWRNLLHLALTCSLATTKVLLLLYFCETGTCTSTNTVQFVIFVYLYIIQEQLNYWKSKHYKYMYWYCTNVGVCCNKYKYSSIIYKVEYRISPYNVLLPPFSEHNCVAEEQTFSDSTIL